MLMRIALAALAALTLAAPARAQTIQIKIDGQDAADLAREISRAVESNLSAIASGLGDAIGDLAGRARLEGRLAALRLQARSYTSEQIDRETRTLAIGATGTLDVDTISGDITVTAGAGRDATIEIVRHSHGRTDADARLGLTRVTAEVDQRPDRARVHTVYPDTRGALFSVDVSYTITAPAGTRITARTVSGDVTIKGIRGDVEADVTSGRIDLSASHVSTAKTLSGDIGLVDIDTDGSIDVRTVSGTITLQNVKARRLTADAVANGDIVAHGVSCDNAVLKTLDGRLDFGGPTAKNGRYELNAFSGTIRFTPSGPVGFDLQASTFSGSIRSDPAMQLRDVSMSRRSLHATYGDGGAVVILKTFSGNISVVK